MEQEIYDLIQTGDEVQAILNKSEQLPSIEQLTQELNGKADVTDLEEEAADRAAGDAAVRNDLTAGTLVPKLSENLENWNDRDDLAVESSFDDVVRTTAGDESINSELGAQIVSLKAVTDFSASALKATGFNLLRNAVTVSGGGYYFLVPKLTFGIYGTANENNGVLFTNSSKQNLTPTVRFKALADGVPTSASDGVAAGYTDSHGHRFYTTPGEGYLIVSGITLESTCAHIAWSRRYDDYVAVNDAGDAGSTIALTAIIAAVHDFGYLLVATRNLESVADSIAFDASKATWTRRVQRVKPSWNTTQTDNGYVHETTIADMKAGGIAECGTLELTVSGNTISYSDNIEEATTDWVKYELATPATGQVNMSNAMTIEDWGLEILTDAIGQAEVTMQYAQGYPDAVANLVNGGYQKRTQELEAQIVGLQKVIAELGAQAEGYVRVSGSSNPALNYKSYKYGEDGGFSRDSVFSIFFPCLIGTKLSGDDAHVGKILYVLDKLGYENGSGQAVDINGVTHAIDGSEGDVMVVNTKQYYRLAGKYVVSGTEYDVFLVSLTPFTWQGYEAEIVEKGGVSPDYTVSHNDSGVTRMHSAYNEDWVGSYSAPAGVVGKFIYSQDAQTGDITETYDADETLLGGSGGCHTTGLALYTGEQQAMNMNPDTTKTVPFANQTAKAVEDWFGLMLAEGGTFDAHKAALMGSGFSSNDPATSAADWEESGNLAKNGIRIYDKDNVAKLYSPAANALNTIGLAGAQDNLFGTIVNSYRNPFKVMEAHRAVSYAVKKGIGELQWFVFEGNKYKYRSVEGFAGPQHGEMTCVVWKMLSSKLGDGCFDPTDKTTSIAGNRIDLLFSVALFHGITTQVSPSWWVSGLVWTEDENGDYRSFYQKDQDMLVVTPDGEIATSSSFNFETAYEQVGPVISKGSGYRKNYLNGVMALPDTDANKAGAGLHTYVCAYNYYSGGNASEGKKLVRGFRRGNSVHIAALSPLCVYAANAPSSAGAYFGFGTCCRVVD